MAAATAVTTRTMDASLELANPRSRDPAILFLLLELLKGYEPALIAIIAKLTIPIKAKLAHLPGVKGTGVITVATITTSSLMVPLSNITLTVKDFADVIHWGDKCSISVRDRDKCPKCFLTGITTYVTPDGPRTSYPRSSVEIDITPVVAFRFP